MKNQKLAIMCVLLAAILGSAVIPFIKIGLRSIPPFTFTFLRFLVSSIVILPFFVKEKPSFKKIIEVFPVVLLSSVNILIFIYVIPHTSANVGQLVYATVPIIVAILSLFLLKEKFKLSVFFGVLLGFVGVTILFLFKAVDGYSTNGTYLASMAIFVAAVFYSLHLIYSKKLQKKYSPVFITAMFNMVTMFMAMILSIGEGAWQKTLFVRFELSSLGLIFYISVFGTVAYYFLQQTAIKYGSSTISSTINFIQPLLTIYWAGLLLGEKVTPNFIIATIMIFIGAYLVSR